MNDPIDEIEMYETSIDLCEQFMEMMAMSMNSIMDLSSFLDSTIYNINFDASEELSQAEHSVDSLYVDTDMAQYIYDLLY